MSLADDILEGTVICLTATIPKCLLTNFYQCVSYVTLISELLLMFLRLLVDGKFLRQSSLCLSRLT